VIEIFIAMALAAGPVEGASPPEPVAGASVASLFSADDYPAGAAARGEQGNVQVVIHVDDKGAVSSCEIKTSSGYPELDTQTCNIIARRAKFEPARNSNGEPVASEITKTIDWRLASGPSFMPSDPWGTSMILTLGPDKQPQGCRMEQRGFVRGTAPARCPPGMDAEVAAVAVRGIPNGTARMIVSTDFALGPAAPFKLGPGDVLMERSVAEISVDDTGHQTACRMIVADGPLLPADDICGQSSPIPYKARTGADGKPAPFTATIATSMIAHVGADSSSSSH
jgi:protein TonB